jgi:hypothetical protein
MGIILAGIAGGIEMFIRSFCSHPVLPLGEAVVGMLPNEPREWRHDVAFEYTLDGNAAALVSTRF